MNGEFNLGMTWFDVTTRSWIHIVKSRMSLRKMMSNHEKECNEKEHISTERTTDSYVTNQNSELNRNRNAPKMENELVPDTQKNERPLTKTNDPLKKEYIFFEQDITKTQTAYKLQNHVATT